MRYFSRPFHGHKATEDDDLYIALLRYGKENLDKPKKSKDAYEVMSARGIQSPHLKSPEVFEYLFWMFFQDPDRRGPQFGVSAGVLQEDAYFKLLEYEELNQARESSQSAHRLATLALVVTSVLAIGSLVIGSLTLAL